MDAPEEFGVGARKIRRQRAATLRFFARWVDQQKIPFWQRNLMKNREWWLSHPHRTRFFTRWVDQQKIPSQQRDLKKNRERGPSHGPPACFLGT